MPSAIACCFILFYFIFLHKYTTSLLEGIFLSVNNNNDYTFIGYKQGNIMSNIINFLVQD